MQERECKGHLNIHKIKLTNLLKLQCLLAQLTDSLNNAFFCFHRQAAYSKSAIPFSASGSSKTNDPVLQRISYNQTKIHYPHVYDSSLDVKTSAGKTNQAIL